MSVPSSNPISGAPLSPVTVPSLPPPPPPASLDTARFGDGVGGGASEGGDDDGAEEAAADRAAAGVGVEGGVLPSFGVFWPFDGDLLVAEDSLAEDWNTCEASRDVESEVVSLLSGACSRQWLPRQEG